MAQDEWLDLVDDSDKVVGRMLRSEVYAKGLNNFRVINGFLRKPTGELWIPRRTAHKKIYPLGLDMGVAGHVESGETYQQTLVREAKEELGIDMPLEKWRFLGSATPKDGVAAYQQVYELTVTQAPEFNREDYIEYFWLHPREVLERLAAGDSAKSDLPILIRQFYSADLR